MSLNPIDDRILITRIESASQSRGVFIPDTGQTSNLEGHVIAVGPGKTLTDGSVVPMEVKAGDNIVYARFAGTEVKIEGKDFVVLQGKDVLAIIG